MSYEEVRQKYRDIAEIRIIYYLAVVAVDEDVAGVDISVDNAGGVGVEILEAFENLIRPFLNCFQRNVRVALTVFSQISRRADFGDEIEGVALDIRPHVIKGDDIFVAKRSEELHLGVETFDGSLVVHEGLQADLVPCNFDSFFVIESPIHFLHGTHAKKIRVTAVSP